MTLTRSVIRRWIQASLLAIGAAGVTQCVDGVGPGRDRSTFRLAPMWSNRASRDLASLGEAGLPLDRVRVVLIRPISDTLKDTTVTVHAGDSQIDLPLTVDVTAGASLRAVLQFKSGETVLFQGETSVQTVLLNRPNPPAVELPIIYVGPGKEATRVDVAPASGTFPANVPITFVATAFDANNLLLANTPFEWAVDDQTMGSFGIGGLFTPSGKDGSVTITATTPTGISGTATVSLVSGAAVGPPASITIISGNAQVDTILKTLANPFVVKVADANGAAVSGVTVTWTRVGGFGTPANATSETDASGLASLVYRLGDIGGADTVHAAVAGVATPAVFTATVHDGLGAPIVTGFAYLRVQPSPATPRLGDTLSLTADSISASGQATRVTAQWASNNPGAARSTQPAASS